MLKKTTMAIVSSIVFQIIKTIPDKINAADATHVLILYRSTSSPFSFLFLFFDL